MTSLVSRTEVGADWVLYPAAVEEFLRGLGFRDAALGYIIRVSHAISKSPHRADFLKYCSTWRKSDSDLGDVPQSTWGVLAVVAAIPSGLEKHRRLGVPQEVSRATFLDLQRRIEEFHSREGVWGFDRQQWMSSHLDGQIFEIGRLQYALGTFRYPYRIYTDQDSGSVISLALPGLNCTPEGWPRDEAIGFKTSLEFRADGLYGHLVQENGAISPLFQNLAPNAAPLLDQTAQVAHIHIPSGSKLNPQTCVASLVAADEFFADCFPDIRVEAYCTSTWLLDPTLEAILDRNSNIIRFARLFRRLAVRNATDHQLLERLFGHGMNWETARPGNSLQRAVLAHHEQGLQFRTTAGFILADDIPSLATP